MSEIWGADWWEAWQAFGTVGAVTVALLLAFFERRRARRAETKLEQERQSSIARNRRETAALVSAWVETEYIPASDGTHYLRRGTLNIANESNEPVFDVRVIVGVGQPTVQIGPISLAAPIPVLPPRRHRSWDISLALLGHGGGLQLPSDPIAQIYFTDAEDTRWKRNFQGTLFELSNQPDTKGISEEEGLKQLGDPDNFFNPIWVALAFVEALRDDETRPTMSVIEPFLAENAQGWSRVTDSQLEAWGQELLNYNLAAHVWYPAPQVAYARLVHEDDLDRRPQAAGYMEVKVMFITLVFHSGVGWRIFSFGGGVTEPDWIPFPVGGISEDPRGEDQATD